MKRAFTLIELVLVLVILAVVTHLAVRELGALQDGRREKAAQTQLEEIRVAAQAFLSDLGRLPRLVAETNAAGEEIKTLSELWKRPDWLPGGSVTNVGGQVLMAVGWRGPYLRLPTGAERLLDPWGNVIEQVDDGGCQRIFADATGQVTNICISARKEKCLSLIPDGGLSCALVVTVTGGGTDPVVRCYSRQEGQAVIVETSERVGNQFMFSGLTPGEKLVGVEGEDGAFVRPVTVKGPVTEVEVAP